MHLFLGNRRANAVISGKQGDRYMYPLWKPGLNNIMITLIRLSWILQSEHWWITCAHSCLKPLSDRQEAVFNQWKPCSNNRITCCFNMVFAWKSSKRVSGRGSFAWRYAHEMQSEKKKNLVILWVHAFSGTFPSWWCRGRSLLRWLVETPSYWSLPNKHHLQRCTQQA